MNFQEKIKQRAKEKEANPDLQDDENSEIETFERSEFFGVDNVRNYPSCLDLRLADGNSKALPYSYISEINFDASEGIEILSTTKKIRINGRNLKLLYNFLVAFRVKYIQSNIGNDLTDEKALFVKEIIIEEQ